MLTFADKRAYLSDSLQVTPGPLAESIDADIDRAAHAAEGLWRRDPAVWSNDAATQRKIADRLGWLWRRAAAIFASLDATGRRALHAHLAAPAPALVHQLADALLQRIETA